MTDLPIEHADFHPARKPYESPTVTDLGRWETGVDPLPIVSVSEKIIGEARAGHRLYTRAEFLAASGIALVIGFIIGRALMR